MNNVISKLSIIVPCYNEQDTLPLLLPSLLSFAKEHSFFVLMINDGSNDCTKDILDNYSLPGLLQVIHHKVNKGYGGAIKSGVSACETEFMITIDADGQHNLNDILKLFELIKLKDADMVIGSRKGIKSANILRTIGKYIIRLFVKILVSNQIFDINSGMKIYKTSLAKKYINQCPNGMSFSDIIALNFIHDHHLVIEEPISLNKRIGGTSTINYTTAFETVYEIFNIIILFNPMKVFLPLSISFLVLGIGWGVFFVYAGKGITVGSGLLITLSVIIFLMGLIAEQLSSIRKSLNN
jgi:glycosyltransferase involved in cell wall biosynthesis